MSIPSKPKLYRETWGLQGYTLFTLLFALNRDVGVFVRTASLRRFLQTPTSLCSVQETSIYVLIINKKNMKFCSEKCYSSMKDSINLHRHVFVMNATRSSFASCGCHESLPGRECLYGNSPPFSVSTTEECKATTTHFR